MSNEKSVKIIFTYQMDKDKLDNIYSGKDAMKQGG